MLSKQPGYEEYKASPNVPEKLKAYYGDFKLVSGSSPSSFKLYEAITHTTGYQAKHMIRILDSNTNDFTRENYTQLSTLFVQELLHLQKLYPGSVIEKSFGISEDDVGKQIFCATLPYTTLNFEEGGGSQEVINSKDFSSMAKLAEDVISDADFLLKELDMKDIIKTLGMKNIGYFKEKSSFILTNWATIYENLVSDSGTARQSTLVSKSNAKKEGELVSSDLALELKTLGFVMTRVNKIDTKEIETILAIPNIDPMMLSAAVKAKISTTFNATKEMQDLISGLLTADFQNLPSIKKLEIKPSNETLKKPKLLACCTYETNLITMIDWQTNAVHSKFQGPSSKDSWNIIKGIPNTSLLCSLHSTGLSSTLQIYDTSQQWQTKTLFTGNVKGGTLPIAGSTAFHIHHLNNPNTSPSLNIVNCIRQAPWYSQYSTRSENLIADLDFDSEGTRAVTIDKYGVCLISDVDSLKYLSHLQIGGGFIDDAINQCKWSPISSEQIVFVRYAKNWLNIFDVEKKALTLKAPLELDQEGWINVIEVCPTNGNLLASAGRDKSIKIFDRRESKIVKTFDNFHKNWIRCMRWSPAGDMIASGSSDGIVKVIDVNTDKLNFTGEVQNPTSLCFI